MTVDLEALDRRIAELKLSQTEVARACGLTQPHLSKILNNKAKAGPKAIRALAGWMAAEPASANVSLVRLARKIDSVSPRRQMQIMHLLAAIERVIED